MAITGRSLSMRTQKSTKKFNLFWLKQRAKGNAVSASTSYTKKRFTKDEWIEKAWPILEELVSQCTDCEFYSEMLDLVFGKPEEKSE